MNKIETAVQTINSSISECESHVARIRKVKSALTGYFPLEAISLSDENDDLIALVDQLIYRFTKLQDSMGVRLFPSLFIYLENDDRPVPFLDILNRFEKLGIIESAEEWQFFRNMRNNLAHDYPESLDQTVSALNILFSEMDRILNLFEKTRNYYLARKEH